MAMVHLAAECGLHMLAEGATMLGRHKKHIPKWPCL